ncbi:hypothetical protein ACVB8X_06945 [Streptomyces sp. NRAIS4]
MANIVWHKKLRIHLDLSREDLGHPEYPDLWDMVYRMDRMYAARGVPVAERDLQCGGVCQDAGVEAPLYLRQRAHGRREAVHERRQDEERHVVPVSAEHKAYQERIVRAAEEGGFRGDSEVRTRIGRSWIQTDTLIEGADGLRIGWEIQLSSAGVEGPRSVRARAAKAEKNGITPAWHTDRTDYARRNDAHWTQSNSLPAHVIAKIGDLRVVSGFRKLDFWLCDVRAVHPCPRGVRRCGRHHATPVPKDVLLDDLVRHTAGGAIVPIQFRTSSKVHRFWVSSADQARYADLLADDTQLPADIEEERTPASASRSRPTCRPDLLQRAPATSTARLAEPVTPNGLLPARPTVPALETAASPAVAGFQPSGSGSAGPSTQMHDGGLPEELIQLQRAADREYLVLEQLGTPGDRQRQRRIWFEAACAIQAAVTQYAQAKRLNRFEVERTLRGIVRGRR